MKILFMILCALFAFGVVGEKDMDKKHLYLMGVAITGALSILSHLL